MTQEQLLERVKLYMEYLEGVPMEYASIQGDLLWLLLKGFSSDSFFHLLGEIRRAQTPEQKRVEANAKLRAEWERERFALECRRHENGEVGHWYLAKGNAWMNPILEYRRKPELVYVPWTRWRRVRFGAVIIAKDRSWRGVITSANREFLRVGFTLHTYQQIFELAKQLDGTPCSTKGES